MLALGFHEDPRLGVVTTVAVLAGAPILLVAHDADDGGWRFLCGTTDDPRDGRIIHLQEIVTIDPSVIEVADLPLGWLARRDEPDGPWLRSPNTGA